MLVVVQNEVQRALGGVAGDGEAVQAEDLRGRERGMGLSVCAFVALCIVCVFVCGRTFGWITRRSAFTCA